MGRVFLLCPSTDRPVDTGMKLSQRAFDVYQPRNARTFCPHCQRMHGWDKERMVLENDPPADEG